MGIHRRNTRLRQQLRQIAQEAEPRPEKVEKALEEVKADFLHSDYLPGLHRRMAAGEKLTDDDWTEMGLQVNRACAAIFPQPVRPGKDERHRT